MPYDSGESADGSECQLKDEISGAIEAPGATERLVIGQEISTCRNWRFSPRSRGIHAMQSRCSSPSAG